MNFETGSVNSVPNRRSHHRCRRRNLSSLINIVNWSVEYTVIFKEL